MANHRKHPAVSQNEVMAIVIEAARKGERCPIASPSFPSPMTRELAVLAGSGLMFTPTTGA